MRKKNQEYWYWKSIYPQMTIFGVTEIVGGTDK